MLLFCRWRVRTHYFHGRIW